MTWHLSKYGWRLLPGGLVAASFAVLLQLNALQPLEQSIYNTLYYLRGEKLWDDRLIMVTIDDASIDRLGRFPWKRQAYVKLLNRLAQADPSVIAFDLVWSEPSPDDAPLAQAMAQSGRVVLATARDRTSLPLMPVPALQTAAISSGHILHSSDSDGITRSISLQFENEPALGVAVVKAYALVQASVPLPNLQRPLWVNWAGRVQQIPQHSFVDVVEGKVPLQRFHNKIVLVGVTASGIDQLSTPFDRNPPASGVHLHAAVINNLLQQNALRPIAIGYFYDWKQWLLVMLSAPSLSWWLWGRRELVQMSIWLGGCLGWSLLSLLLFQGGVWVPVALPLGIITFATIAVEVVERLRTNALLQQQIHQLWQRYRRDMVVRSTDRPRLMNPTSQPQSGSMQSVTQLATLADQFGRSQSTQAAIARSLSIGLLAADWDGLVWFCNPVATAWLQVQIGEWLESALVPHWLTAAEWQTDLSTLKQRREMLTREIFKGDRWFELKLEPLNYTAKAEQATQDGLLMLLEDITVRKRVEAALEQQVLELRRLSQMKDDFLSTVSHELRAPLTNMRLAIELLSGNNSNDEVDYYIKILERECTRETDLINDLLDLQRLEAAAQQAEFANIELAVWMPVVVEPFYRRAAAQQQTLEVKLMPNLPAILTCPHILERIVVELVNNACKYTPPGEGIQVAACHTSSHIELVVANSGVEIPERELSRIFDKFYRVPQSDPWKRGGTGLGLALVKKLVEQLNGTIQVKSVPGCTTFTVQLPLKHSSSLIAAPR